MYKSPPAQTKDDVQLIIDMGGIKKVISVYLSLEESDPEQHVGMQVWIGGGTLATSTLCYQVIAATFSRWINCSTGMTG
jgi:hypothetical protein